ncbi:hypothetical protein ACFFQF_29940 [Haladaptatus pallidirubidus]|uniref:hypothetical protein n=1 Tax=Haladaptatus pallidirubidus TaxID=1008152 RepID=UPI0035EF83D7
MGVTTLLLVSTLTVMVDTVISPALPALHAHFTGVENVDLLARLVLTFSSIFVALSAPVIGTFIDRIGWKLILQVSVGLYGFAGGAECVIDSLPVLLASRALLGSGRLASTGGAGRVPRGLTPRRFTAFTRITGSRWDY